MKTEEYDVEINQKLYEAITVLLENYNDMKSDIREIRTTIAALNSAIQRCYLKIPQNEIENLCHRISMTQCSIPKTSEISKSIAKEVMETFPLQVENNVKSVLSQTELSVVHHHVHTTSAIMYKYAETETRKLVKKLIFTVVGLGIIIFILLYYLASTMNA